MLTDYLQWMVSSVCSMADGLTELWASQKYQPAMSRLTALMINLPLRMKMSKNEMVTQCQIVWCTFEKVQVSRVNSKHILLLIPVAINISRQLLAFLQVCKDYNQSNLLKRFVMKISAQKDEATQVGIQILQM